MKTKTKKKPHVGLAPTPERIATMDKKGFALGPELAARHGIGVSTLNLWKRNGKLKPSETVKVWGCRWYSKAAVARISPLPGAGR